MIQKPKMKPAEINRVKEITVFEDISQRSGTKIVCKKRVVHGKMCVTVLSISAELMRKLQEASGEEEQQVERVARFCSLRIHFFTSLGVSIERLSDIFASAFRELNEMSDGVKVGNSKEPIFNLVPVLGVGNSSASLDNIIASELFALRS